MWGGGIIKIPQRDWIPWPIDLDVDENLEGMFVIVLTEGTKGNHSWVLKQ